MRFCDFNLKICDFPTNSRVKVFRKDYNYKTIVKRYFTPENVASGKNFISLDIREFGLEKSWLKVFEMMKKSLHLQPQTKKNHEIFNEHNYT